MMRLPLSLALVCLLTASALAATVSLSWLGVADPSVTGYRVRYSNYSTPPYQRYVDVGNVTSATFNHISSNRTYCFAVTALVNYSSQTVETAYSNHMCGTIAPHPDYAGHPRYRTSGTDNPRPAAYPYNPLPDCTTCHIGGTP